MKRPAKSVDLFEGVASRALLRKPPRGNAPIALADIEHARSLAARIVIHYGAVYKPLFDCLDRAHRALETEDDEMARIRKIAQQVGR